MKHPLSLRSIAAKIRWFIKEEGHSLINITLGAIVFAISIQLFVIPAQLPGTGVNGLALLFNYMWGVPLSVTIWGLNALLFIYGWKVLPRRFTLWSIYGTVVFTLFLSVAKHTLPVPVIEDRFLLIVVAGLLQGAPYAMIFAAGGSLGGTDIISMAVRRKTGMEISQFTMIANFAVLALFFFAVSFENVVYGVVLSYINTTVMGGAMRSFGIKKEALVICNNPEETKHFITHELGRGVTIFSARGGYSDTHRDVFMTLLTARQAMLLKQHLQKTDPKAFLRLAEATEVLGQGFGSWKKDV
nr:YitT family protein [uncultured Dethiosulfovibrio sp.]